MTTDYRFKNSYLPENFKSLQVVSEMASRYDVEKVEVIELFDCCNTIQESFDCLSFHPNGRCGCILSKDEYIFGIRCNHLMWCEGSCEGSEKFWGLNDRENDDGKIYECIFVYGNHKGGLVGNLIVLHK